MPNNLNTTTKPKINSVDKIIFFICIVDTLFFPYIRVISASFSMILLPLWYVFNLKKIKISFEFQLFMILASLVVLSVTIANLVFPYTGILQSNITTATIFLYGFLYYFFYRYYFQASNASLKKFLMLYTLFGFILALIYLISPNLYFDVRSLWTMSGNDIDVTNSLTIFRFTSTFSDPNNASVAFVGVMTFLLFNKKTNSVQSLLIIGETTVILFVTMSNTGFIAFALVLFLYFIRLIKPKKNIKFKKSVLLNLAIICFIAPMLIFVTYKFIGSDFAQIVLDRVSGNSADSRFDIWKELLNKENITKYILYGMGGTLIIDGTIFKPHNGHLHLIYNYGMIVYAIFIYIYFRKRKNTTWQSYLFLVPFILGFTINVGIYEPRFVTLLTLLLASYASANQKHSLKIKSR